MKAVVLPLFGLAIAGAGAFIRACEQAAEAGLAADLASAFCMSGVAHPTIALTHQHCAGCAMLAVGAAMIIATPLAHRLQTLRRTVARIRI